MRSSVTWPFSSPKGRRGHLHDKTPPPSSPLGKMTLPGTFLVNNFLAHLPSHENLPFCSPLQSSLLLARWDSAWFMNHLKPIGLSNLVSWRLFFNDSKDMKRLQGSLKSLELEEKVSSIFMSQIYSKPNHLDLGKGFQAFTGRLKCQITRSWTVRPSSMESINVSAIKRARFVPWGLCKSISGAEAWAFSLGTRRQAQTSPGEVTQHSWRMP